MHIPEEDEPIGEYVDINGDDIVSEPTPKMDWTGSVNHSVDKDKL